MPFKTPCRSTFFISCEHAQRWVDAMETWGKLSLTEVLWSAFASWSMQIRGCYAARNWLTPNIISILIRNTSRWRLVYGQLQLLSQHGCAAVPSLKLFLMRIKNSLVALRSFYKLGTGIVKPLVGLHISSCQKHGFGLWTAPHAESFEHLWLEFPHQRTFTTYSWQISSGLLRHHTPSRTEYGFWGHRSLQFWLRYFLQESIVLNPGKLGLLRTRTSSRHSEWMWSNYYTRYYIHFVSSTMMLGLLTNDTPHRPKLAPLGICCLL